jgi:hypothetical protein
MYRCFWIFSEFFVIWKLSVPTEFWRQRHSYICTSIWSLKLNSSSLATDGAKSGEGKLLHFNSSFQWKRNYIVIKAVLQRGLFLMISTVDRRSGLLSLGPGAAKICVKESQNSHPSKQSQ